MQGQLTDPNILNSIYKKYNNSSDPFTNDKEESTHIVMCKRVTIRGFNYPANSVKYRCLSRIPF